MTSDTRHCCTFRGRRRVRVSSWAVSSPPSEDSCLLNTTCAASTVISFFAAHTPEIGVKSRYKPIKWAVCWFWSALLIPATQASACSWLHALLHQNLWATRGRLRLIFKSRVVQMGSSFLSFFFFLKCSFFFPCSRNWEGRSITGVIRPSRCL